MKNKFHRTGLSVLVIFLSPTFFLACNSNTSEKANLNQIKSEIQKQLDIGVIATKNKDIDSYMALLPDDFIIYDESGEVISREKQREYALRDWAIIDSTLEITVTVDSLSNVSDTNAIVFTSQIWKRLMFQRDGKTIDTVLTTQRHQENWKKRKRGWFGYDVKELGGKIFINGKEYKE